MAVPTTAPLLTDGTVTIRGLDERDLDGCYEQCVDPLSIAWTQVPVPYSRAEAMDFCLRFAPEAWADGSQYLFAVQGPVDSPNGYAGNIALRDEGHGRLEIAYGAHPAAHGTGVLEAGVRLMVEWGFSVVGARTMIWRANVGNWGSRHLAHRLGFSFDGVLRHSHLSRGELVDAWLGTLLAGEPRVPRHRWLTSPVLEGDGVRLRPLVDADLPRIVETCSDERTQAWLGRMPSPYTEADARAWLAKVREEQATGRGTTWAITAPDDDVLLGSINAFDVDPVDCEIGYWAHPEARGRGLMRAAMPVVTSWAFAELGVQRVRAVAALANSASRHVIEATGFRQTGEERLGTVLRSGLADVALYDVVAEEWSSRR